MWCTIKEFPRYEVSDSGGIRDAATKRPKYCEPHNGYLRTNFIKNKKRHRRRVHRLVAEAFIPNTDDAPTVNHKNGVKTDNTAGNLEWMTVEDNVKHGHDTGLMTYGTVKCLKYAVQLSRPNSGQGLVLFGYNEIKEAGFNDEVISIHANKPGTLRLHQGHEVAILPLPKPIYW